ncbi:MAG: hypothetical protein ACI4U5_04455 [Bacilli bacterium]
MKRKKLIPFLIIFNIIGLSSCNNSNPNKQEIASFKTFINGFNEKYPDGFYMSNGYYEARLTESVYLNQDKTNGEIKEQKLYGYIDFISSYYLPSGYLMDYEYNYKTINNDYTYEKKEVVVDGFSYLKETKFSKEGAELFSNSVKENKDNSVLVYFSFFDYELRSIKMDFSSYPTVDGYQFYFDENEKSIMICDIYSNSLFLRYFIFFFDDDFLLKKAIVYRYENINTNNGVRSDHFYDLCIERVQEKIIEPLSDCIDGLLNFDKYLTL